MLTVIGQAPSTAKGQRRWVCRCDCGTEKIVMGSNLKRGTTVSCGCKHKNDFTGQRIGKLYNLGSYILLEDAVKARRRDEEEILDTFLDRSFSAQTRINV